MRTLTLVLALSALALAPAPAPASEEADDGALFTAVEGNAAPGPAPADKARVVVVRPTSVGFAIKSWFLVDGEPLGVTKGSTWLAADVPAGTHVFWSKAENVDAVERAVEAGKTYWFQQHIQIGALKARTKLEALDEGEGLRLLAKCKRRSELTDAGRRRGQEIAREYEDNTRADLERRAREAEKEKKEK